MGAVSNTDSCQLQCDNSSWPKAKNHLYFHQSDIKNSEDVCPSIEFLRAHFWASGRQPRCLIFLLFEMKIRELDQQVKDKKINKSL